MKKAFLVLLIILILAAGFVAVWYTRLSGDTVPIHVAHGASARAVARTLKENNIIISERLFLALVRLKGAGGHIMPGNYYFSPQMLPLEIIRTLQAGPRNFMRVTVPEGLHMRYTAEILERSGAINSAAEFIEIAQAERLEGFLMPETYVLAPGTTARNMIRIMVAEFDRKVTPEMHARAEEIGMTMHEVVTLASIVEREAVVNRERPKVASVFLNRLAIGQRLESCATVQFALGETRPRLFYRDLRINSPYNTYLHAGLPPGPIASPGLASIKAVLWPADTNYFFFVSRGDGTHLFGRTFADHRRNIAQVRGR
ncbi:MAG: endolytic transglycosylase MltG [Elusimicrobia bacterium]|nr:endolytic transglycosylase MltG [Elusimicrobiota bacterium]